MTIGYAITLALALGLFLAYLFVVKNKEPWLTLLYVCVVVVNAGYLLISVAKTLPFAIFGNDVAYLGSVFLSACMLLTILRLCGFRVGRTHAVTCVALGCLMFAIVATSGFLPWYYKSVSIETVDGATRLVKEYGVLHPLYLVYLLGYFGAMIGAVLHSVRKKKLGRPKFALFLTGVVCGNLLIWLFEKLVAWEFEFLSVTYIISDLLLLLVYWMMQDYIPLRDVPRVAIKVAGEEAARQRFARALALVPAGETLAPREREILGYILENKKRREIAEALHLSENTVKTYTRTLYAKLGVSNREELYALLAPKQE